MYVLWRNDTVASKLRRSTHGFDKVDFVEVGVIDRAIDKIDTRETCSVAKLLGLAWRADRSVAASASPLG